MSFTSNDLILPILIAVLLITSRIGRISERTPFSITDTTLIRGLMALFIVLFHIFLIYDDPLLDLLRLLSDLAVGSFFFISGFGLMSRYLSDPDYERSFLKKRFSRILLPYVIVNLLYWAYYRFCGEDISLLAILERIIQRDPLVSYSWYIIEIVVLYLFFYVFMKLARGNRIILIILHAIWYGCFLLIAFRHGYAPYLYRSTHMYLLGLIYSAYADKIDPFLKRFGLPLAFLSLLSLIVYSGNFVTVILAETGFIFLLYLFLRHYECHNVFLEQTGKISLEIYLIHGLVIKAVRRFLSDGQGLINILLILLIVWAAAFVLNRVFRLLDRFIQRI